jgi:hypothetical protein
MGRNGTENEDVDKIQLACESVIMAGSCGHGNQPSDSIKQWIFLDQPREYQRLKEASAPINC